MSGPAPGPASRPGPTALIGVGVSLLGGLLLVALAARSRGDVDVRPRAQPSVDPRLPTPTAQPFSPPASQSQPDHYSADWLGLVVLIALIMLAVPVLVWLARLARRHLRRWPTHRPASVVRGDVAADDLLVDRELSTGIDEGLARLDSGPVRDAIIACWIELERAATRSGVARLPSETAAELVARLLGVRPVDARAAERLADLYREARFSAHRMDERARSEARFHLQQVRSDLSVASTDG